MRSGRCMPAKERKKRNGGRLGWRTIRLTAGRSGEGQGSRVGQYKDRGQPDSYEATRPLHPYMHSISRPDHYADIKMQDHVECIEAWQIFACVTCKHALWPQEIVPHFRNRKHKMKLRDAQSIRREAMQKYPDVIQDLREWIHLSTTVTEIP